MSFALTTQANQALESYAKLLLEWNGIHSLSGARDLQSVYKNIQDSLYPLEFLGEALRNKTKLFDVGSGNGFPAVALGIALGIEVVLCEPNAKKAAFLQNLKSQLGLKNFMILRQRVEEVKLDKKPDLITSRATFSVEDFLKKTKTIIGRESLILLYKGSLVENEIPQGLEYERFQKDFRNYLVIKGEAIC